MTTVCVCTYFYNVIAYIEVRAHTDCCHIPHESYISHQIGKNVETCQ